MPIRMGPMAATRVMRGMSARPPTPMANMVSRGPSLMASSGMAAAADGAFTPPESACLMPPSISPLPLYVTGTSIWS